MYFNNAWNKNALRRWQKPGDITDIPRIEVAGKYTLTDNYLIDASYFAIKNITLGYTLPEDCYQQITPFRCAHLWYSRESSTLESYEGYGSTI